MSDSKKKVPKRRFEEFSNANDWEQRKLGEVTESFDGKRVPIDSGLRVLGEYPYYGATGIIDYVDDYIFDGEYVLLAEDGANIIMRNNPVAYLTQGKFWLNNHAHIMRIIEGNNYFLVQVLEKIDYIKYNTGTAQPKLNSKIVKNIEFKLPQIEEQQKIGAFFKQLDDTIALHQRKLEKIKALKTAYLSEMFPAEGESKPKRRIAGFTDDWEQRKLMSVFEFPVSTNSLSRSQLNYDNGEIKSVHYGDILVNYDSILEIAKDRIPFITNGVIDKYKPNLLENGDLIFADAAEDETVGKAVEVDGKTNEYIVAGLHTIVARPRRKMAKFFWGYYINSSIYHNQLLRLMQGTKVASISKSNLQKTCIAYPDNFAEQQKLGNFFKQLDNTITLHQRKLQKLQNIKKAYLNEMFI
ncbi:restriction endonuclease subunit S [Listeria seeligeri]|uniref:restriction endonuclease subunit S n=1 Tax=Listeria seeligeri TaxID=1640 RepID=UPI001888CC74|nr:restriction endonuclease subunit S [Listeria seeligeri]MBF2346297.1 restriction endonuclease subunit S [Listeria seeligeri]